MLYTCVGRRSLKPYYMDGTEIGIYSAEELAYYIKENILMLDSSFMDENLCSYIESELGLGQIATELYGVINRGGSLMDFLETFFKLTGLGNENEIESMRRSLASRANMSQTEKYRLKGDFLVKGGKFSAAINEYNMALSKTDEIKKPKEAARILNNKGVAFAGMFCFDEAEDCFEHAFRLNPTASVTVEQMKAAEMMNRGKTGCSSDDCDDDIGRKFRLYLKKKENGEVSEADALIREILMDLKNNYRKSYYSGM
ncbi:MAG: tetratricopeptide repeat protein [Lachnospiraceae bacterium]|nr:tetratricopeptide repeat protein [Lachnospiraceae bacterium]